MNVPQGYSTQGNNSSMPTGAYSSQQGRKEKRPSGYRDYAINMYTPEQEQVFQQSQGLIDPNSFTSRLAKGDQSAFSEMEEPALRQFGDLQAGLASRFSGMGMGGQKSSGFQNALTSAGQDFASQLQAKRMELRNQAIKDMMGMSSQFLGFKPQEKGLVQKGPKKPGWGEAIGTAFGVLPGLATGDTSGAIKGGQNILSLMGML
jgi:hypothetical protein